MAKIFITLTGTKHYFGNDFLKKGMKIRLEKEPDNEYDKEAIKVTYEGLGKIGYTDLLSKLSLLMDMGKKKTKYNVLNLNSKFTVDQKQTLEHVFDALYAKYTNAKANDIIQTIIDSF